MQALQRLSNPASGRPRAIPAPVVGAEAATLIRALVASLPERQRVVMQAYIDNLPESANMEALRQEVSRRTGEEESRTAVKAALREGRRKLQASLRQEGYSPEEAA